MDQDNHKVRNISVGVLSFLIIFSLGYYFLYKDTPSKIPVTSTVSTQPSRDIVADALAQNPLLQDARSAFLAKDYEKVISLSEQVLATSSSTDERSVAENSIAQAYFSVGKYEQGAQIYYSVYNNTEYADTVRAAALNSITQQYRGTLDKTLLKPIFPGLDSLTTKQMYDQLYQKIYSLYPLGIASAWVGTGSLESVDRSDKKTALEVYNKFALDIDRDIEFQSKGTGSAYIIPNIYMAKARFMIVAYSRFEISSIEEISATYEKAANLAESGSNPVTKQFALLEYANFLANENQIEKAEQVFQLFASQRIEPVVISNFSNGNISSNWPGLAYLYTKSQSVRDFADKNSIKP